MSSDCKTFHNFKYENGYKVGICAVCGVGKIYIKLSPGMMLDRIEHSVGRAEHEE